MKRHWSVSEREILQALYPNRRSDEVARLLGRPLASVYNQAAKLGLHKSIEFLQSPDSGRLRVGNKATQFKKGQPAWNKGKHYDAGGRSHTTRFKPGNVSARWDTSIYTVGALRLNSDGGLDMKVAPGPRQWVALHRWTWEKNFGPIPKGFAVRAKDGDLHNCDPSNLYLASRADLMRQNTVHNYPPPLRKAIQLLGQLKRRTREREEHRHPA